MKWQTLFILWAIMSILFGINALSNPIAANLAAKNIGITMQNTPMFLVTSTGILLYSFFFFLMLTTIKAFLGTIKHIKDNF